MVKQEIITLFEENDNKAFLSVLTVKEKTRKN